ncbi:MAG TPA: MBL fold metallo-hydrolase [Blastocatellia bacterium]|nr:MBL fold metallo-hydrolase [Blastocatellia bacterium]
MNRLVYVASIAVISATLPCVHGSQNLKNPAAVATAPGTRIVMLGTGTPVTDPDRSGPAVAVTVDGLPYIVDCGPGVVRRAAAAYKKGEAALKVSNLKTLFITHLHSDHTLGYSDMILSPAVLHRGAPLEVFGPPGIKSMTDHLMAAYQEDIKIRINGLEHGDAAAYRVNVHEIKPGTVFKNDAVTVTAFPVKHGSWAYAFGYRFETRDKTVVISGDTAPAESIIENCRGCDVLIHEVYSKEGFDRLPAEDRRYHSSFHTSSLELAALASKARPRLLILYHQLFFRSSEESLLREVRGAYSGKVVSAHDLDVY